ncbi:MAG: phosphoglucomutase/phosphomannomutase family protein [Dehalococcoidales bacterium]|nr:phosphoglucomutase/phosphomannomutase family protein [Dehalococcoidales bacterium]
MSQIDSPIKFGTDGWRGIIAQDFTFDNVRICAQGVANYLKETKLADRGFIIGYDTRFASEDFAAATAEVLAGNGIKVYLCPKATPTPIISYGVLAKQTSGAAIITASHNPAKWNGFKVKSEHGSSAPTQTITKIENHISHMLTSRELKILSLDKALNQGMIEYLDLAPIYGQQVARLIDLEKLARSGFNIIIDSMYGAGAGYFKMLLGNKATGIIEINDERNPLFPNINPEPIAKNLTKLSTTIRNNKANVGLATDGDADRIGIMDENGNFLTTLQVFALLCLYLLEIRGERGPLIKTITTTSMIYRLGELFNVPVLETSVGFKYVAPLMLAENALIGGEESGGYGFRGHVLERDGILAGLYFLDLMLKTGKTPSELLKYLYSKVGPHHFKRVDLKFPANERETIINHIINNPPKYINGSKVVKIDTNDGFRYILADTSWLLIRFSGTEPVLRIYAESATPDQVDNMIELGKLLVSHIK